MEKDEEEEKTVVLQKYIAIRHLEFAWPILLTRYASSRWGAGQCVPRRPQKRNVVDFLTHRQTSSRIDTSTRAAIVFKTTLEAYFEQRVRACEDPVAVLKELFCPDGETIPHQAYLSAG